MKSYFKIRKKNVPIMAGESFKKIRKIGVKTVYFVHSKIDDALLFEGDKLSISSFCNVTTLR